VPWPDLCEWDSSFDGEESAQKYLPEVAERVSSAHPEVHITWEVATASDVAHFLVSLVRREDPSYTLLAMATHGRTGIIRWVWGSITERVVQKTQLPLLLVRPAKSSNQPESAKDSSSLQ
jgi:nucleotide-binding universal stress UspA family protein